MTEVADAVGKSFRPSLKKLVLDLQELETELVDGIGNRREILQWTQQLTVRTLGRISDDWYRELAEQFRANPSDHQGPMLLEALMTPENRSRRIDERAAENIRNALITHTIRPASHRAFRKLRNDAGEYIDSDNDQTSTHSPQIQRYIAMRPALDEIDDQQQEALEKCIDGFDGHSEILEWTRDLELATHGEINDRFRNRAVEESSTRWMLTTQTPEAVTARMLFAAHYLIPAFNAGVRDLSSRAGEMPQSDESKDNDPPDW